jgi:ABC-type nitrate/sulfonate/bicarbonate transport system substrate-binding protein
VAAVELGFFKAEGLEITNELLFPVPKTMAALRDGELDFVAGSAHATLTAFKDWAGAKLLAALAQHTYWFLVLRADLGAKRGELEKIKGCRIGAAPGVDLGLQRLLQEAGLDPRTEGIQIQPVPGATGASVSFGLTAAKALEEGKLDGFWANGMGAEVAVRAGVGTIVLDVRRGDGPPPARHFTFPALITSERVIARDPKAVESAVRAIVKTQKALKEDPERATAVGQALFPPNEAKLIAELVRRDVPYYDAHISEETVTRMNRFARDLGLLGKQVSYEDVVATQFAHVWDE